MQYAINMLAETLTKNDTGMDLNRIYSSKGKHLQGFLQKISTQGKTFDKKCFIFISSVTS